MKKILIVGATGNLGSRLVHQLLHHNTSAEVYLGVRHIQRAQEQFAQYPQLLYRQLNFEHAADFRAALEAIDTVFLLSPPQLSDVKKSIGPFIRALRASEVQEILFLSVQGAGKIRGIPHTLIEKLIKRTGKEFIFLRPSYFMQNLSNQLLSDMLKYGEIALPSKRAKFVWVDLEDVALAAAELLLRFQEFKMRAFNITGKEQLSFPEVVQIINNTGNTRLQFRSVGKREFYRRKREEGMSTEEIQVMYFLHFLPRFINHARPSRFLTLLTGKTPYSLSEYAERELLPLLRQSPKGD